MGSGEMFDAGALLVLLDSKSGAEVMDGSREDARTQFEASIATDTWSSRSECCKSVA
jgi:hypothetical protein